MGDIVGVIPDLHIPAHKKGALDFIERTFNQYKVDKVLFIGDLVDHHYIGFHPNETDALNPVQEWEAAAMELKKWIKAFPDAMLCYGNHDERPGRAAQIMGLPEDVFLKTFNEVYSIPRTWSWKVRWDFGGVFYEHGLGSNGMYGAKNTALKLGSAYVQGHTHAHAAVFDIVQARNRFSAMNVGCLVDKEMYNFRYARKFFKVEMSLGCGIVLAPDDMKFVPFKEG